MKQLASLPKVNKRHHFFLFFFFWQENNLLRLFYTANDCKVIFKRHSLTAKYIQETDNLCYQINAKLNSQV